MSSVLRSLGGRERGGIFLGSGFPAAASQGNETEGHSHEDLKERCFYKHGDPDVITRSWSPSFTSRHLLASSFDPHIMYSVCLLDSAGCQALCLGSHTGLSVQSTLLSSGPPSCVRRACQHAWDTGAPAFLRLKHVWEADFALSTWQNWRSKPSEGSRSSY